MKKTSTDPDESASSTAEAIEDLKKQVSTAMAELKKLGVSGRDVARAGAHDAADRASALGDEAKRSARSVEDAVIDYVDREPLKALAIALGTGAVFGLWLRRR